MSFATPRKCYVQTITDLSNAVETIDFDGRTATWLKIENVTTDEGADVWVSIDGSNSFIMPAESVFEFPPGAIHANELTITHMGSGQPAADVIVFAGTVA